MINNYDAAFRLLNIRSTDNMRNYPTFKSKQDLFFIDHEFVPLLVQESYLNGFGDRNSLTDIEAMAEASDLISTGDLMNIQIRKE